jgi:hypothetical protein
MGISCHNSLKETINRSLITVSFRYNGPPVAVWRRYMA